MEFQHSIVVSDNLLHMQWFLLKEPNLGWLMLQQTTRISTVKPDHCKFLFGLCCLSDKLTKNTGLSKKSLIIMYSDFELECLYLGYEISLDATKSG